MIDMIVTHDVPNPTSKMAVMGSTIRKENNRMREEVSPAGIETEIESETMSAKESVTANGTEIGTVITTATTAARSAVPTVEMIDHHPTTHALHITAMVLAQELHLVHFPREAPTMVDKGAFEVVVLAACIVTM